MYPLLVNTVDIKGGAARAAYRLHEGLRSVGVDSKLLARRKYSGDQKVIGAVSSLAKGYCRMRHIMDYVPLIFYPGRKRDIFSLAGIPDLFYKKIHVLNPDIINLHWIAQGAIQIESIGKLDKPVVWTLHDMWAFSGGCHYDEGCGRYTEECGMCPQLGSQKQTDLSHWVWQRKKRSWQGVNITIVTPSRWLADCAKSSSLFLDRRVEVIPNGLNLEVFKPADKAFARKRFGLPENKKLVLFGAAGAMVDKRKGFQFLEPIFKSVAAQGLCDEVELVVYGSSEPENPPELHFRTHYTGELSDDESIALLYSAADVFIAPSVQDNMPNTVMESIACGTPVVAFDIGGMPDMIEHQVNGFLAKPFDTNDLARGISWVLGDLKRLYGLSVAAREKAVREYSLEIQAKRYLSLYNDVLKNTGNLKISC